MRPATGATAKDIFRGAEGIGHAAIGAALDATNFDQPGITGRAKLIESQPRRAIRRPEMDKRLPWEIINVTVFAGNEKSGREHRPVRRFAALMDIARFVPPIGIDAEFEQT